MLNPIDISRQGFDRFLVTAFMALSTDEMRDLMARLSTSETHFHARTRRFQREDGRLTTFEERFGLDPVEDDEDRAYARLMLDIAEGEELPASFLHLDIDARVFASRRGWKERVEQSESMESFWSWIGEHPDIGNVGIRAWATYDPARFEPVVPLPFSTPAEIGTFSEIPGLWLARRDTGEGEERILYEVLLRADEGQLLTAFVRFRSIFEGTQSALEQLLDRAAEIAAFAVQLRSTESESGE